MKTFALMHSLFFVSPSILSNRSGQVELGLSDGLREESRHSLKALGILRSFYPSTLVARCKICEQILTVIVSSAGTVVAIAIKPLSSAWLQAKLRVF